MSKSLTWNDRLALIDHFSPSDEQATAALGVTQEELDTARCLKDSGTFSPTADMDFSSYEKIFTTPPPAPPPKTVTSIKRPERTKRVSSPSPISVTTLKRADFATKPPQTATKKAPPSPQKRGRKGSKITNAYKQIPNEAVPVEDFAKKQGCSVAVLRQSKRFDPMPEAGQVLVRKNKTTGLLMIWREKPEDGGS